MPDFDPNNEEDWKILLRRVDTIPVSLALAQSASESAWGSSRFAVQGNNFFGEWCYEPGCGLVPKNRLPGRKHMVETFGGIEASVDSYMHNLNSHEAYVEFRKARKQLRNSGSRLKGLDLLPTLQKFSERRQNYLEDIRVITLVNNLERFDS